jgi:hypothetical protein
VIQLSIGAAVRSELLQVEEDPPTMLGKPGANLQLGSDPDPMYEVNPKFLQAAAAAAQFPPFPPEFRAAFGGGVSSSGVTSSVPGGIDPSSASSPAAAAARAALEAPSTSTGNTPRGETWGKKG